MSTRQPATPREARLIGAGAAAFGAYFMLVGLGVLPPPGGPRNLHGPMWIAFAAGLAFFLAGVAIFVQALGRADDSGELPAGAPTWMRVAQYLFAVAVFACLAAIGTWVAFGGGTHRFSGTFMLSGSAGEIVGRAVFGLGAFLCWFATLAYAIAGARRLRRRNG